MRHRNIKGAYEKLEIHPKVVDKPEEFKGKWKKLFDNNNPIYIEIGMGKGQFISRHAKNNPNINYIGFEKYSAVLAKGLEKIDKDKLDNIYVIREDAENILDFFEEGELEGLYLNFSDPWPKDRHEKRRLTHSSFLEKYKSLLKKGSFIELKTDNDKLFEFSIEQLEKENITIDKQTRDLYASPLLEGNIPTEYEEKFHAQSISINKLRAYC